uniref:Hemogen n=1 Tax=Nothobranchius rachovii TaxID=451742 RepID=A0A1A8NZ03_9TELE
MVNQIMHLQGGNRQQSKSFSAVFSLLARLQLSSFIAAVRMEESKQELENQNEEEGGIRRRLRDRDLLRKRKAEAEEKETNQEESQKKRSRAESKSRTKKRGRPRKTEPAELLAAAQDGAAGTREDPAVVVVPEPAPVISDHISQYPEPFQVLEPQSPPAPEFESVQSSFYFKSAAAAAASVSVRDPDVVSAPSQDFIPPAAPPQVEILYTESQSRETHDQVLIQDLGPDDDDDEEEDTSSSQNTRADEGLNKTLLINMPEQNKMFSVPTLSSPPLPQEYLPGN